MVKLNMLAAFNSMPLFAMLLSDIGTYIHVNFRKNVASSLEILWFCFKEQIIAFFRYRIDYTIYAR